MQRTEDVVRKWHLVDAKGKILGQAATEVWGAYADLEGTNAYDQALEDFSTTGETLVCGEPYLSRLDLSD